MAKTGLDYFIDKWDKNSSLEERMNVLNAGIERDMLEDIHAISFKNPKAEEIEDLLNIMRQIEFTDACLKYLEVGSGSISMDANFIPKMKRIENLIYSFHVLDRLNKPKELLNAYNKIFIQLIHFTTSYHLYFYRYMTGKNIGDFTDNDIAKMMRITDGIDSQLFKASLFKTLIAPQVDKIDFNQIKN